jgi:hypothetical protein
VAATYDETAQMTSPFSRNPSPISSRRASAGWVVEMHDQHHPLQCHSMILQTDDKFLLHMVRSLNIFWHNHDSFLIIVCGMGGRVTGDVITDDKTMGSSICRT